jgi:CheY-like chemotaxis protein/anti-sigma regulatory factor (Ser/Thr protein kinase)
LEQINVELARSRALADEARLMKDEFAASVSHELRTPLNMIIGFSEMMVLSSDSAYDEPLPLVYRPDVEAIYRNATHISSLIDDILDLSQIDAHRMALQKEDVSLALIVDDAITSVAGLFHERRLRLIADLSPDLTPVHVDPTRVRQILLNLLTNAARFTDRGGVTISASCHDHEVLVTVADTGVGMTPDEIRLAFEPFGQVRSQHRTRVGNGLGLAISQRFIEMHGGTMWAESQPSAGTTFKFTLPVSDVPVVASPPPRWEAWMTSQVARQVKTVLAVDPEGDAVRLLQRYLDVYRVLPAASVDEIRAIRAKETVHAIVLTSASGLDEPTYDTLGGSGQAPVPTIICPFRNTGPLAPTLGVVDYLVKPVTVAQLRQALRRIDGSVRSVLVVDDDVEMARLLERMIRSIRRRCRVWHAQDGQTGLELLRQHHPKVVLLDLLMPGVDGYAVLEAIREDPELRLTPVIVISARGKERESVFVDSIGIRRAGGLTVGETMRLLRASLDALITPGFSDTARGQSAGSPGTPVLTGSR